MKEDVIAKLLAIFREESSELLDRLAEAFSRLARADSSEQVKTVAYECMRLAHNLKGAAASVGFDEISRRAHALEDEIAKAVSAQVAPGERVVAALIETTDELRRMILSADDIGIRDDGTLISKKAETPVEKKLEPEPAAATRGTVRIASGRLDRVMAHAEELFSIQSRERAQLASLRGLIDRIAEMTSLDGSLQNAFDEHLRAAQSQAAGLDRLVHDLTEALRDLRMIPFSSIVPALQRVVRDAARSVDKSVRLDVSLGDLEIDKAVLDLLQDPILHLLRNSVDHGIESQDERARLGKPTTGRIVVSGELSGSSAHLFIDDDGRGLDPGAIRNAAESRDFVAKATLDALSDDEIIDLIFASGFSTRAEVGTISGRGVGLDVVRTAMDEIGGRVRVIPRGRLGGARFALEVPLSILSTRGLLVECGSTVVAIPIESVERTIEAAAEDIVDLDGALILRREGADPLGLITLHALLDVGAQKPAKKLQIAVLSRNGHRLGLLVDRVRSESEFVTRRLPWNLRHVPGISGAVVQPDGRVGLVLDVSSAMEEASNRRQGERTPSGNTGLDGRSRARILVVDDSLTVRTLHRNTLLAAGYDVSTAVDGDEALRMLDKEAYALLVTDVEMPIMDGIELTRRVRASAKLRNVPVILVTSRSRPTDVERGTAAGADEYIVKGALDQQKLLDAVAKRL